MEYMDDMKYRIYVTESLRGIPRGSYVTNSYFDIIEGRVKVDARSGDEIAADIINRHGLRFKT